MTIRGLLELEAIWEIRITTYNDRKEG